MKNWAFGIGVISLLVVGGSSFGQLPRIEENKIYWEDSGVIHKANLDGTDVENVVTTGMNSPSIITDFRNGHIYWLGGGIQRANLDGTNIVNLVDGVAISTFAIDFDGGKIYWSDILGDFFSRCDLDGTNVEPLLQHLMGDSAAFEGFTDLVIDPSSQSIFGLYYNLGGRFAFWEYHIEINFLEGLFGIPNGGLSGGLMLDLERDHVYFSIAPDGPGVPTTLHRYNIDGTGELDLMVPAIPTRKFGLDTSRDRIYYTTGSGVFRVDIEEGAPEHLVALEEYQGGIMLDIFPGIKSALPKILEQWDNFLVAFSLYDEADLDTDGLPELASILLMEGVSRDGDHPFWQGLSDAYDSNLPIARDEPDVEVLGDFRELIAALMCIGDGFQSVLKEFLETYGIVLTGSYVSVNSLSGEDPRAFDEPFSGLGDADEDGFDNATEYVNVVAGGGTLADFVEAALDSRSDGTTGGSQRSLCIISNAARGTMFETELAGVRSFRDSSLLNNPIGTAASGAYYRLSSWWLSRN